MACWVPWLNCRCLVIMDVCSPYESCPVWALSCACAGLLTPNSLLLLSVKLFVGACNKGQL